MNLVANAETGGAYLPPQPPPKIVPLPPDKANERLAEMLTGTRNAPPQAPTAAQEEPPPDETYEERRARAMEREDTPENIWTDEQRAEAKRDEAANESRRLKSHREKSTAVSAYEWLNQPDEPDEPIISELIERGEMFALVGQSKAGKSLLVLQMAVCIATGRDFIGRKTERTRVYLANLEVSAKQYRKRLRAVCRSLEINPADLGGWLFIDNMKGIETTWEWLRDEAQIREADLVIIDPFYQVFVGKETDEAACLDAVKEMKKFQKAGRTLGIAFHSPKGFSGDRQLIDMISGSSVLARFPESIIGILNHATDERARVIACELRNYPKPDAQSVIFADGAFSLAPDLAPEVKSANGKPIKFKSPEERKKEKAAAFDKEQSELRDTMMRILTKADNVLLSSTQLQERLAKATHLGKHTVEDFLRARKDDGEIKQTRELVEDGETRGSKKKGGKLFVSTPERIDAYLKRFEKLPFYD